MPTLTGGLNPLGLSGRGYDSKTAARNRLRRASAHFLRELYLIAVSRFHWKTPPTMPGWMIEQSLCLHGSVCIFRDSVTGAGLALPSANAGQFNVLDIPKKRIINRANGYHAERSALDSVLCFNDATFQPYYPELVYYAEQLADLEAAKLTNIKQQQKSKIILTDKSNRNTVKNVLAESQLGVPYVLGDDALAVAMQTSVLDLSVPPVFAELEDEIARVLHRFCTALGINVVDNFNISHKTVDEVNANDEMISVNRRAQLAFRQEACEEARRKLGLEISVEYKAPSVAGVFHELTGSEPAANNDGSQTQDPEPSGEGGNNG